MANTEDNYQHDKKCPKCGKRQVYLRVTAKGAKYVCKVDGYTWPAYVDNDNRPKFEG